MWIAFARHRIGGSMLGLCALTWFIAALSQTVAAKDLPDAAQGRWRIVWVQDQSPSSSDTLARGKQLRLMGFDNEDGRGERAILETPRNYSKPLLTPDGQRVVYSDQTAQKVYVVDFDGSNKQLVCDGYALDVWTDPKESVVWVYVAKAVGDVDDFRLRNVRRVQLANPKVIQSVWDGTQISPDNFQLSADGTQAAGEFPWPDGGIVDLTNKKWQKRATGCWSSLAPDNSGVSWVFDGLHRNLQLFSPGNSRGWSININKAPNIDGFEVFHPRWSNHARYFVMTGPYKVQGKVNFISGGGPKVEVYLGRFAEDFASVEAWFQITNNDRGDFYPDAWFEKGLESTVPDTVLKAQAEKAAAMPVEKVTVRVKRLAVSRIPEPRSILPYRNALVMHRYQVERVEQGQLEEKEVLIAHWGIRNGAIVPEARMRVGESSTYTLERLEDHRELKGERQIVDGSWGDLPLFYDVTPKKDGKSK